MKQNLQNRLILELMKDFGIFSFATEEKSNFFSQSYNNAYTKSTENIKVKSPEPQQYTNKNPMPSNKQSEQSNSNNAMYKNDNNNIIEELKLLLNNVTSLIELQKILNNFKECSLSKTATNTVFGSGNPDADLLMIGEAPGADEDLKGEPFVGRSGKLLTKALESLGILRKNIFITNSVFWRPPGNRNPTNYEVALCRPFVEKIISLIKPKMILIVGKVAATNLLEEDIVMGKVRGNWLQKNWGSATNMYARVIYHPAYLLRNPKQKKVFWFDIIDIFNKIKELQLNV